MWFVFIATFDLHWRKVFQLEIAFNAPLQSHLDIPVTHFTTSVSTSPPYLHPPPSPHRKPHIYTSTSRRYLSSLLRLWFFFLSFSQAVCAPLFSLFNGVYLFCRPMGYLPSFSRFNKCPAVSPGSRTAVSTLHLTFCMVDCVAVSLFSVVWLVIMGLPEFGAVIVQKWRLGWWRGALLVSLDS